MTFLLPSPSWFLKLPGDSESDIDSGGFSFSDSHSDSNGDGNGHVMAMMKRSSKRIFIFHLFHSCYQCIQVYSPQW